MSGSANAGLPDGGRIIPHREKSECVKKSAPEVHIPIDCSASVCDENCNNHAAEDAI
jgi:hypothetical protein